MGSGPFQRRTRASGQSSPMSRFAPGLDSIITLPRGLIPTEIVVGMSVAAIAVPGGLAMAQLMGVPPEVGLYACIVPAIVYALIGPSSRFLVVGPDTATCMLLAASATTFGVVGPAARADLISVLTLLVAILCLIAYLARLGLVCTLISRPVLLGYLAGVAVTLLFDQLSPMTGVELEAPGLIRPVIELTQRSNEIHWLTVGLGLSLFIILRLVKRYLRPVPGPIVVLVLAIIASWLFDFGGLGVALVGKVPSGLPTFHIPETRGHWTGLLQAAAGIMVVSASSGIITARAFGEHVGARSRPNQELVGFGFANLAAAFFQGFVVTGSDSRTAAAVSSGGRSALVGVVAALTVGLVAMFLVGPIAILPSAALAAILASAAVDLVDIQDFRELARINKHELVLAAVAVVGVIWIGVLQGVVIAVGATLAHLMVMAARPRDGVMGRASADGPLVTLRRDPSARQSEGILVYLFESSLFFVNADYFGDRVRLALMAEPKTRYLVLDTSVMMHADSMAVSVLTSLIEELRERDIVLLVGGGHGRFREILYRSGLAEMIGLDLIFTTPEEAFTAAEELRDEER
ncbi:MAG: SulP family inorganic anion transporter [Porphyrobacter sp.]|nr:SulP family inorganic anion transporter [Porphyrobacter sp.]